MAEKLYDQQVKVPGSLKFSKIIVWLMYIWVMFGVIVLSLRVFLLAFSANTAAGFGHFIMETSATYLNPFRGLFQPHQVSETGYLDVSALFAIIIYLLVAWGFSSLIHYLQRKIDYAKDVQQKEIDEAKFRKLKTTNAKPAAQGSRQ